MLLDDLWWWSPACRGCVLKLWLVDWIFMEDGHFDFWGWAQWIRIINWPIESRLTCVDSSMMAGIKSNKSTSWQDVKRGECWCWTGKTQVHTLRSQASFLPPTKQTLNNKKPKSNKTYCATVTFEMVKAKTQRSHSSLYSTCLSWLRVKAWQIWLCRCFTSLLSLPAFTVELV